MSTAALIRPRPMAVPDPTGGELRIFARGRSLAIALELAWAGLQASAPVACPVCEGRMEPRWSAGSGIVGGRCRDCAAELA